jgi:hypothetical protein
MDVSLGELAGGWKLFSKSQQVVSSGDERSNLLDVRVRAGVVKHIPGQPAGSASAAAKSP